MAYLIFDTETTGVPKNYKAPMSDLDNWPRIIQLAWVLYSDAGDFIAGRKDLIKPDGWVVPTEKFWVENGFTQEQNMNEGIPIAEALGYFIQQINTTAHTLVAHNFNFDFNILGAEMIRSNMKAQRRLKKVCTMLSSVDFCKLPAKYGFKWPKLIELHIKLFNEGFEGAHDALADVKACGKCFFRLRELGVNLFS